MSYSLDPAFDLSEVAMFLHTFSKGTSDPPSVEAGKLLVEGLKTRLTNWTEPSSEFEHSLKMMCRAAIAEFEAFEVRMASH